MSDLPTPQALMPAPNAPAPVDLPNAPAKAAKAEKTEKITPHTIAQAIAAKRQGVKADAPAPAEEVKEPTEPSEELEPSEEPEQEGDKDKAAEAKAKPWDKIKADFEASQRIVAAQEARLSEMEKVIAKWDETTTQAIVERDHYKRLAEKLSEQVKHLGYELDPREQRIMDLEREASLHKTMQERHAEQAKQTRIHGRTQEHMAQAQAIIARYPELSPASAEGKAFWEVALGPGKKLGMDLDKQAASWMRILRGARTVEQKPAAPVQQAPQLTRSGGAALAPPPRSQVPAGQKLGPQHIIQSFRARQAAARA